MQLLLSALFLKLHPLPLQHTPSYENSVIFGGVSLGRLAGVNFARLRLYNPDAKLLITGWGLIKLGRRLVIGILPSYSFCELVQHNVVTIRVAATSQTQQNYFLCIFSHHAGQILALHLHHERLQHQKYYIP